MKNKTVQVILIIILLIIAISLMIGMIVMIMNKDKNNKLSFFAIGNKTKVLTQKEYNINEINNIAINTNSSNVKFVEGEQDKIKVTIYGLEDEIYDVNVKENKLEIRKEKNNYFIFALFFFAKQEIRIELPKDFKGDLRN